MAKKETIEMIVDGGKAAPNAAIAQKLGPMKIPIPKVMEEINKKTAEFKGMKIPVKIHIDTGTKDFTIDVGSPSVTELIKKEIHLEKGSGTPNRVKAANMAIEQAVKVAKMKHDALLSRDLKASVKQVIGSAGSLGILVEGMEAHDAVAAVNDGKFDAAIQNPGEVSKEKIEQLKQDLDKVNEELKKALEKAAAEAAAAAPTPVVAEGAAAEAAAPTEEKAAEAGKEAKPGTAPAKGAPAAGAKPGTAPASKGAAPAKAEEKKPAEKGKK
ncbi:MAG TPA: 50S ribosomal protein L11 [Candidatus Nanoarchaeia archaeon]|nr:50S ribosomal protein L11 [Candidatus Nanoarchaeia archaeon]